jgi:arginase
MRFGQPRLGPDQAPELLRGKGVEKQLKEAGYNVLVNIDAEMAPADETDAHITSLNESEPALNYEIVKKACRRLDAAVSEHCQKVDFTLILGGDHSISMGTVPALTRHRAPNSTGVVWVDAHADLNTMESSESGNLHGMSVAFLLGLGKFWSRKETPLENIRNVLDPKDLVYIGLRDIDQAEREFISKLGIKSFTMADIDHLGIAKVMELTLDYLKDKSHLHLSLDIDAVDPGLAPHTGTPVPGGLSYRESNYICEQLAASDKLNSMEVVEVSEVSELTEQPADQTLNVAITLIGSGAGKTILDRAIMSGNDN